MTDTAATVDLVEALATHGYAVANRYLLPGLCDALRQEAEALAFDTAAIDAGVGRGSRYVADVAIRRARIRWLDGSTPAQNAFLAEAERLRSEINRLLFLGLVEFEAQFALTPVDGFYARHFDSFQGKRNRMVSLVAYLNEHWTEADGGQLRLWPPAPSSVPPLSGAERPTVDITPAAGTLVLMLAEDVPHEVLRCHKPRCSIAGWFRVRGI